MRYRYEEASGTRVKTIELIVEKAAWRPPKRIYPDDALVPVRIRFADNASREKAKAARERRDPEKKVWFMCFGKIKGTSLEKHIVLDAFPGE